MKYAVIINDNSVMDKVFETYRDAFLAVEDLLSSDSVSEGDDFDIYKLESPAACGTISVQVDWEEYDPE